MDVLTVPREIYVARLRNLRCILERNDPDLDNKPEPGTICGDKRSWVESEIRQLEKLLRHIRWTKRFFRVPEKVKQIVFNQSSMDTPRYLCISNGFRLWCLDLKLSSSPYDEPRSPPLVTLTELTVPVSVGLFKFASNVYMIGGQHLIPTDSEPPLSGWDLYKSLGQLYLEVVEKGPSCDTYRLSLDEDDDDDAARLSLSKCNPFGQLNKPKLWPIVEKVDGKLNVFDNVPADLWPGTYPLPCPAFSHEFLNPPGGGGCSWTDVSAREVKGMDVISHLVVGDRIYAVSYDQWLMFDSSTTTDNVGWVDIPRSKNVINVPSTKDPFTVKQVWNILDLGMARCLGEFPLLRDEEGGSLYVVVAVVRDWGSVDKDSDSDNENDGMLAVAYLVTLAGRVLCSQHLPQFFEEPLLPSYMYSGRMIDVDEEGKTLCAIIEGNIWGRKHCHEHFLYISTFSMEMPSNDADAISKARQLRLKLKLQLQLQLVARGKMPASSFPVEEDFVRIVVKDRYIYTTAAFAKEGESPDFPTLQACFL